MFPSSRIAQDRLFRFRGDRREERRVASPYEDALRVWLDVPLDDTMPGVRLPPRQEISWPEIAEGFLQVKKEGWKDINLTRQVATAIRAIGWEQHTVGPRDARRRVWRRTP